MHAAMTRFKLNHAHCGNTGCEVTRSGTKKLNVIFLGHVFQEFLSHVYFDRDRRCQIQNFKNHQTLF